MRRTNGQSLGTFKKSNALLNFGEHWTEKRALSPVQASEKLIIHRDFMEHHCLRQGSIFDLTMNTGNWSHFQTPFPQGNFNIIISLNGIFKLCSCSVFGKFRI
jgi:hypothetical protein